MCDYHRTTRKDFVLEAVNSALSQTLRDDMYEVIVVKNFEDSVIDSSLDRLGVRSIVSREVQVGAKIREGVNLAQNTLITFLEDDDLYAPERLEAVAQAFADDGVGYYHNSQTHIDRYGREIQATHPDPTHPKQIKVSNQVKHQVFRSRLNSEAYANTSSIAISKDVLLPWESQLSKIRRAPDLFIFLCAVTNSFKINGFKWIYAIWGYRRAEKLFT
ncbi:hypothetical protein B9Q08_00680 [Candidatus Marsarchaeota G2 archaeon ECH_B_SAG-M15]|uniref:Glycosyltransferase 2-like domain-containing protein n=1 Tax=Candidatus Marsarchaeota G2 archaeon ECH_B_SAG-M15 TaxID=1978162 RepID=A0A2R6B2F0_9ARCH|nr:MAG: hypothetical protein B9Q08_00680 [Candidatus Marsarchaeota G2 archaeon ECH_B_SAG-M15]